MNVANGLPIGWPNLAKIMGSQGFYVRRLQLDPYPLVDVVWQKKRSFLVAVLSIVHTLYGFSQKIAEGMNVLFALKNIY